jgi:hypothetical protein
VSFDLGDTVGIGVTVRDAAGAPTNATTVTLTVTLPDGTTTNPTVANPPAVAGEYGVDYLPTVAGHHTWRLVTTAPSTALVGSFDVWPASSSAIVSLADVKRHLNKSADDTADDEELREYLEAATAVIEEHRGETVVRRTVVEDMQVGCALVVQLPTSPVQALTSVATVDAATTWDVANLHVSPHGVVTVQSGPQLQGLVRFTFVAGYTVVPANYTLAAKIIAGHLWETQQQPGLGPTGPFGTADGQFLSPTGRGFAIPNRAVELLGRRPPLVA